MSNLVTLITCTGMRPQAFSFCEKMIARQTYKGPLQWIIVDDGTTPIKPTHGGHEYYKGPRIWEPGLNTHRFNMELALSKVKGEYTFIIEDDDYYSPNFIQAYVDILKHIPIVGEGNARYYHVEIPGHKQLANPNHSALSQTAFRTKEVLPLLTRAVNSGELYFDMVLWAEIRAQGIARALLSNSGLSFGMKGLPGRPGITPSHREKKDYMYDSGHATLKKWVGADAIRYVPFASKQPPLSKTVLR